MHDGFIYDDLLSLRTFAREKMAESDCKTREANKNPHRDYRCGLDRGCNRHLAWHRVTNLECGQARGNSDHQ